MTEQFSGDGAEDCEFCFALKVSSVVVLKL